jgi:hypothetical protein
MADEQPPNYTEKLKRAYFAPLAPPHLLSRASCIRTVWLEVNRTH